MHPLEVATQSEKQAPQKRRRRVKSLWQHDNKHGDDWWRRQNRRCRLLNVSRRHFLFSQMSSGFSARHCPHNFQRYCNNWSVPAGFLETDRRTYTAPFVPECVVEQERLFLACCNHDLIRAFKSNLYEFCLYLPPNSRNECNGNKLNHECSCIVVL